MQRVGKGFIDALSGNMLDFDKKGGKPSGVMRNLTGIADFATANMFDLDKRGEFDLFGRGRERRKNCVTKMVDILVIMQGKRIFKIRWTSMGLAMA